MAMRANLLGGRPIFTNIRQWEVEIEKRDIESIASGRLPSMVANALAAAAARDSPLLRSIESDLRVDNAVLAFIMTKELAFLNRTIQMISLIARRCQEEQEDANWGKGEEDEDEYLDDDDDLSPTTPTTTTTTFEEFDLEADGGGCGGTLLQRSQSHDYPYTPPTAEAEAAASERTLKKKKNTNDLFASTSFLLQSGRLLQQFNNLCQLTGTNVVLVNAMTFRDRARSSTETAAAADTAAVQSFIISDIFLHFTKFDAEHRDPVVAAFLELRDISVNAWRTMSRLAFANLFRLTAGTEYETLPVNPEDAIFSNH
jgi:hypothetical protein